MPTSHPLPVRFDAFGISILESHHTDAFRMEWTEHSFFKLLYLFRGNGEVHFSNEPVMRIDNRAAVFIPSRCRHRIRDERHRALSLYIISFEEGAPAWRSERDIPNRPFRIMDPGIAEEIGRHVRHTLSLGREAMPGAELNRLGRVTLILARIIEAFHRRETPSASTRTGTRQRVDSYIRQLEHDYMIPDTLDRVCRRLEISRRRFTQLFREATGRSWIGHLHHLRLTRARRLLAHSERSIAAIAFECGFEDLSHFYRLFSRATGTTPGEFRKRSGSR